MEIPTSKLLPHPKEKERSQDYSQDELLPHPKKKEMWVLPDTEKLLLCFCLNDFVSAWTCERDTPR